MTVPLHQTVRSGGVSASVRALAPPYLPTLNVPTPSVPTSLLRSFPLLPESLLNEQDLLVTPDSQVSYSNGYKMVGLRFTRV